MPYYKRKRRRGHRTEYYYTTGVSLGSLLATCLSWDANHSVPWAIFHFVCSWWYVLYWAFLK